MARALTGIHDDKRLRQVFLERYVEPRRQIQRRIIEDAIASCELKSTTDPELLIDALMDPCSSDGCRDTLRSIKALLKASLTE